MARPKAQVRPLAGLLGAAPDLSRPAAGAALLGVEQLRPAPEQPRRVFPAQSLAELTRSIQEQGVLQPLLVRPVAGGGFEIVAGERRWRAAQEAGLSEVPVLIRDLTDLQARMAALTENLQREGLSLVDEVDAKLHLAALALDVSPEQARQRLIQLLHAPDDREVLALDAAFSGVGESWRSFAKNKLRVLRWPAALLAALREGLPYSTVGLLVPVDGAHHARLLALIRDGAGPGELRAQISALSKAAGPSRAARVGKLLSSARWLSGLDEAESRAVERWLEKAPAAVRAALEKSEAPR